MPPQLATAATAVLGREVVTRGTTKVPDEVLVEIVDEVYLPLLHGRGLSAHRPGEAAGGVVATTTPATTTPARSPQAAAMPPREGWRGRG